MCGIVGIASRVPTRERAWLARGRDQISHRGPDDAGEWWSSDGAVGLAHRRLSIIDLSANAHQPMHDGGDLTIVFNGEIYNYRELREELRRDGACFETESDTEVILKAYRKWGQACPQYLDGMFAFALFDARKRMLVLARDRTGEKPLFYRHATGELRFSSELKGLLADASLPRRADVQALDLFLSMGFVPGDGCILDGFSKLPPAHVMAFDLTTGELERRQYWVPPRSPAETSRTATADSLVERLENVLTAAIRRQLVADVPVGILLSGGMDSSLVTALAARHLRGIRTFTVSFPGSERHDESKYAGLIASHFGTTHEVLEAENLSVELLPMLARQFDEPILDSSMVPTFIVTRAVRAHCKVALGGDGGDELFGGYGHYSRLAMLRKSVGWIPRRIRSRVAEIGLKLTPDGYRGRNWLRALATVPDEVPLVACYFDSKARKRLLPGIKGIGDWPDVPWPVRDDCAHGFMDRVMRVDYATYLVEDILVKVDRAAMRNSLEVRSPFLDRQVVEFAFGAVPWWLKVSPEARKILLGLLATRLLPPEFDPTRKHGFSVPLKEWLTREASQELLRDALLSREACFERTAIQELLARQHGAFSNAERVFGLAQFELWRRQYGITI